MQIFMTTKAQRGQKRKEVKRKEIHYYFLDIFPYIFRRGGWVDISKDWIDCVYLQISSPSPQNLPRS